MTGKRLIYIISKMKYTGLSTKKILENWYGNHLIIAGESFIVGILTGLAITAFRKSIDFLSNLRIDFYNKAVGGNLLNLAVLILAVIGLGLFMGLIIKKYPMIKGSGVSQIKGKFMKKLDMTPWPELPLKFLGGVLNISAGLSIGREGPSVQIGAYIGSAFEKIGKTSHIERVCLVTSGAAAGLAATFGAPFAGIVFAIEDLHQYLSPLLLTCVMLGAFAGDLVSSVFFKQGAIFDFHGLQLFPIKYFGWLLLMGAAAAVIGHLFKKSIYTSQKVYKKLNIPPQFAPLIPYLISVPVCLFLPLAASGGDHLIEALAEHSFPLSMLILILAAKIIFTGLSAGSGAIGGIFVPLLSCGALTGIIFSNILVYFNLIEAQYAVNLMVFAMAAFFTTVIKAPVTAIVLLAETSGDLFHLGGLVLTSAAAYITANIIKSPPNDEVLLKQILNSEDFSNQKEKEEDHGKQVFEVCVSPESFLDGKPIKDVTWPDECLIVSIARGEEEIIPDGSTSISAGDRLVVLTHGRHVESHLEQIAEMAQVEE
ncbi:ClC family H(+)/Cl(-) exchange transporter [Treponema sp. OMZ 788]|uniref:ClC family H(+)/Cl(-) exchange transporter n=1 Tax=Treponema sp. OMZ 788 TaxID=2563664 RepID=UPI0020A51F35|nr:ClC family H(+)/Cl(-) exchange transporter [Treponema sp. OMZ 788]UTC65088.1 ClC family H(+)/Cl(-) exchange transporter [Treponema sp. OMZ 788]